MNGRDGMAGNEAIAAPKELNLRARRQVRDCRNATIGPAVTSWIERRRDLAHRGNTVTTSSRVTRLIFDAGRIWWTRRWARM